jgi:hypothetical protein
VLMTSVDDVGEQHSQQNQEQIQDDTALVHLMLEAAEHQIQDEHDDEDDQEDFAFKDRSVKSDGEDENAAERPDEQRNATFRGRLEVHEEDVDGVQDVDDCDQYQGPLERQIQIVALHVETVQTSMALRSRKKSGFRNLIGIRSM